MRTFIRLILLIGLLAGSLYLFNRERVKLRSTEEGVDYKKARTYSLDELQNRRNRIIRNIQDGI